MLLLVAAVAALVWANTPWSGQLRHRQRHLPPRPGRPRPGPVGRHWAADGLLAIFFFVAGIELKRELVAGRPARPARRALPVVAALCGMVVPALVYVATVNAARRRARLRGWAVPTATDIAFALAVLAVIGTSLPVGAARLPAHPRRRRRPLRDPDHRGLLHRPTCTSGRARRRLVPAGRSSRAAQRRSRGWWLLLPLALVIWALMYSGRPRHHRRRRAGPDAALSRARGARSTHAADRRRSTSSTWCARSRPASPCRCSRSSAPVSRSSAARSGRPCTDAGDARRRRSASSSARPSASSAAPG